MKILFVSIGLWLAAWPDSFGLVVVWFLLVSLAVVVVVVAVVVDVVVAFVVVVAVVVAAVAAVDE